jgi:hypothetical protein
MNDQPNTIRFSLRAIFIGMSLVGIGVLTLKYPYSWVLSLVNLAVAFSIVFALISAVAGTGNHQLFCVTYGVMAVTALLMTQQFLSPFLPDQWIETIYSAIHSEYGWSAESVDTKMGFVQIVSRWEVVVLSTAAAYTIPWLATRRNTAPQ